MRPRRVVMLAMPCAEVVEVGGVLDIFYAVNERLRRAGGESVPAEPEHQAGDVSA